MRLALWWAAYVLSAVFVVGAYVRLFVRLGAGEALAVLVLVSPIVGLLFLAMWMAASSARRR